MTNQTHPTTLLAFFARGREIGFVLLESGQIIHYGVKTIKGIKQGSDLARRVEIALAPVLASAGSRSLIVIEGDTARLKGALRQTITSVSKQWARQGREVRYTSWRFVKERFCGDQKATYGAVIQATIARQPLLWSLVHEATTAKIAYWKKVLLAAALAEFMRQNLEQAKYSQ